MLITQTIQESDEAVEPDMGKVPPLPPRWCPPLSGVYKLNVDAAQPSDNSKAGFKAIIRDSNGYLIAALARNTNPMFFVFESEIMAVREGLCFAQEVGIVDIIIETDAFNVYSEIKGNGPSGSLAGHIADEI